MLVGHSQNKVHAVALKRSHLWPLGHEGSGKNAVVGPEATRSVSMLEKI